MRLQIFPPNSFCLKPHHCAVVSKIESDKLEVEKLKFNTLLRLVSKILSEVKMEAVKEIAIELRNPLSDLISDEIFELLKSRGLLHERTLRDYTIRKKFKLMRKQKIRASDAIEALQIEFPYLEFDTIRKIVYQRKNFL